MKISYHKNFYIKKSVISLIYTSSSDGVKYILWAWVRRTRQYRLSSIASVQGGEGVRLESPVDRHKNAQFMSAKQISKMTIFLYVLPLFERRASSLCISTGPRGLEFPRLNKKISQAWIHSRSMESGGFQHQKYFFWGETQTQVGKSSGAVLHTHS